RRYSIPEAPKLETAKVERGRIAARVTATGTLSALVTVQVGSQVSGRIQSLEVDFNSPVKKGQRIARIDPQLFEAALEQSRANHLAAQANVARAKAQAWNADRQRNRARALAEQALIPPAEGDAAEAEAQASAAQVQAAESALAQARAALNQARINLEFTSIYSPIDGVVISRNVDVGQTVASALQAPTLFTIAEDLRKMQVHTNVAEADVGKLAPGQEATLRVDAYPNEPFAGTINQIRNAPQTLQNVVTYDAVIDVNNAELKLKPGMTANVTVIYAERDNVLKIPNAALRFRPPPGLFAREGQGGERRGGGDRAGGGGEQRAGGRGGPGGSGGGALAANAAPGGAPAGGPAGGPPGAPPGGGRAQAGGAVIPAGGAGTPPAGGAQPGAGAQAGGRRDRPQDDRKTLWVLREGKPTPVRVKVGLSDGSFTELMEGELREGDEVITDATGSEQPRPSAPGGMGGPGGGNRGPGGGGMRRVL
ncbi:MAG TPA: efflux RND transporter periplasmic adaptor subunit, partial [Myxococcaceae bacterium]|nr:efflux RND transporter periplasmic adaptor subunit [Myxococcaceae bacterium]